MTECFLGTVLIEEGEFPEDFENSPRTSLVVLQRDKNLARADVCDALMGLTLSARIRSLFGQGDQEGLFGFCA